MTTLRQLRRANERWGGLYLPHELGEMERLSKKRDDLLLQGFLSVIAFEEGDREGYEVLTAGDNLIVDLGREALRELSSVTLEGNGAAGTKDLGFLAVGRGSVSGSLVPAPSSTVLFDEATGPGAPGPGGIARPSLVVTAPPPGPPFTTSLFTGQIGPSQLIAPPYNVLNEMALFCRNNSTMFSFRTFTDQVHAVGFTIEARWPIIF